MQMEGDGGGGSQQPSCSDSGHILSFRKIMDQELEPTVPKFVGREAQPTVREEIQSSMEKKYLAGGIRNDSPVDRAFRLKFLGELPGTVLTGTVLISKENEDLKLALHNSEGRITERGPGSSAKVEVVVLEANDGDDENNMTGEEFESRIIKTGENKKPHFAKDVYVYLKEGVGILTGVKLGHGKDWIKKYNCRLGARMGQNLNGVIVREAWTPPFEVKDKRIKNNDKHDVPKLDSEVWRLVYIGRNGALHKQLEGKNIVTLRDFLFWFYVNPEGLKQILCRNWKAIVTHANKTCISDDKIFSHKSSSEPQMSVLYTAVGKLKGVINESHFVHVDNLSADKKEDAHKLLMSVLEPSAFVNRYDTFFDNEASLLQQYPLTDLGLENRCPPIRLPSEELQWSEENHLNRGGDQINAGASENEMRRNSCRPSTMNSFQENGARDLGTIISITDRTGDATSSQGSETFFDGVASYFLELPPSDRRNFDEVIILDPGMSFEDFYSTRDVPRGWRFVKFVVCLPKWWFSTTVRVARPHVSRKRKR